MSSYFSSVVFDVYIKLVIELMMLARELEAHCDPNHSLVSANAAYSLLIVV